MAATGDDVRGNIRTQRKAAIKRASARARSALHTLDRNARGEVTAAYKAAREDIEAAIRTVSANTENTVRLEVLQDLLRQVEDRIDVLSGSRNAALDKGIDDAARLGVRPFEAEAAVLGASLFAVADDAAEFVRTFVAEDGLQLSDRLWRLDMHAKRVVGEAIQTHVIQGNSATAAARDFLLRGAPVPADIAAKQGMAQADRVARVAGEALMTGEGSPWDNALRVFRTEINRAHGEAFRASAFEHPDVIGTKFLLSPNHPRPDICDMHATVNRYGLGPGVYPKGRSPLPAHPNTLSFEEVVFNDEVSDEDRAGKEDRIAWLEKQPPGVQEGVLASRKKRAALEKGLLKENEIATPWRVLKKRYARRGIDVDGLRV